MLCAGVLPASAHADLVYWTDPVGNVLSVGRLDNSGGSDLSTGVTVQTPVGAAIDSAQGRLYWANAGNNTIDFTDLGNPGHGGTLNTTGATVNMPEGVSIDPVHRRIYWANAGANKISFADLGGMGGGDLKTTGATVTTPTGIAVDTALGRVYWANHNGGSKISFANLDGSGGGGDLNTTGVLVNTPLSLAIDNAHNRIYWADFGFEEVSFANLDNSGGGGFIKHQGATLDQPNGVALDTTNGRIYWTNASGKISAVNLDGSGGGDLVTTGTADKRPDLPLLLQPPHAVGSELPEISGTLTGGSKLTCSNGSWAPDQVEAQLYMAPERFAFQWSQNGADIPGATARTITAAAAGGEYRCRVTASNPAGAVARTSLAVIVAPGNGNGNGNGGGNGNPAPGPLRISLSLAAARTPARGPVSVLITNPNAFSIEGTLSGQVAKAGPHGRPVVLAKRAISVGAHAKQKIKLALPKALQHLFARKRKLALALAAAVSNQAGESGALKGTLIVQLQSRKR